MANTAWSTTDKVNVTLSGSDLTATSTTVGCWVRAADKQVTGKFYWEVTTGATFTSSSQIGVANRGSTPSSGVSTGTVGVVQGGTVWISGTNTGINIGSITPGSLVGVAMDAGASLLWFRLGAAGNWNGNAGFAPNTGVGGINITAIGGAGAIALYPYVFLNVNPSAVTANFGDTAFSGTVPSGFTSGFTAGATVNTNTLTTQVAVEHWLATNPDAQITQIAVEHWTSVQTTFARPANPSAVLSASRAGAGSVVISS